MRCGAGIAGGKIHLMVYFRPVTVMADQRPTYTLMLMGEPREKQVDSAQARTHRSCCMRYASSTRVSGILADGPFVPPVVIPFLSLLLLALWAVYRAIAN